jgi:hypothetical protein
MRRLIIAILILGSSCGALAGGDPSTQRVSEAKMLSTLVTVVNSPEMSEDHYILQMAPSDFGSDDLRAVFSAIKQLKQSGRTVNREAVSGIVGPACSSRVLEVVFSHTEVQENRRRIRYGTWELSILQSFFEKYCAGKTQDEIVDIFGKHDGRWWASQPLPISGRDGYPDQSKMAFRWVYRDMKIKNMDAGRLDSVLCVWFYYRDGYKATGFETMTLEEYRWKLRLGRP